MGSLKDHFRPEFLNRLDDIIIFKVLSRAVVKNIVGIQLELIEKRLADKGVRLVLSDAALDYLATNGYDPNFGARPLKRLIQDKILNQVASLLISRKIEHGGEVLVDLTSDKKDLQATVKKTGSPRSGGAGKKLGRAPKRQEEHAVV